MVEQIHEDDVITLILRPNCSASWYQSKLFLLVIMIPMFVISIGWTIAGAWPVLPLVGLEFVVLCYLTYLVSYRSYQKDTITIEGNTLTVKIEIGKKRKESYASVLSRSDTHLCVTKPQKPMDMQILHLEAPNECIEVGHHLNEDDREDLRRALTNAGINQRIQN